MLTSLSVDEILLLRYVKWSINFQGLPLKVETDISCLKHTFKHKEGLLLFAPCYAAGFWFCLEYLCEAQDHVCSLHLL